MWTPKGNHSRCDNLNESHGVEFFLNVFQSRTTSKISCNFEKRTLNTLGGKVVLERIKIGLQNMQTMTKRISTTNPVTVTGVD